MDIKEAFLMAILLTPLTWINQKDLKQLDRKVGKLSKLIYELKQALRFWNLRFNGNIKTYGFEQNVVEPCVQPTQGKRHCGILNPLCR